jgi:hypothetical protein
VFDWRAEYARQDDHADGSAMIDANYYRIDLGWEIGTARIAVLHEVLGGDGNYAFQTPFATLHAFNGVTDKFLVTPVDGLTDNAIQLDAGVGRWTFGASWHRFTSDAGAVDYGGEIGIYAARPLSERVDARLELADYSADVFAADTSKAWFTMHVAF